MEDGIFDTNVESVRTSIKVKWWEGSRDLWSPEAETGQVMMYNSHLFPLIILVRCSNSYLLMHMRHLRLEMLSFVDIERLEVEGYSCATHPARGIRQRNIVEMIRIPIGHEIPVCGSPCR
jgi:hypothetical protein